MRRGRPFLALLGAEAISTFGTQLSNVALPWFVLSTTGSATRTGAVLAAELAAVVLLGLPAGVLAARLGARRTMLACDLVRAPTIAAVPILHHLGALSFPLLLALAFLAGAAFAPYVASQRAILPAVVGEEELQLARRASVLQTATRLASLLGPVAGGVLIGLLGAANVLVVDAATYVIGFALIATQVPRVLADDGGTSAPHLLDGARALARDRLLAIWTVAISLTEAAFQATLVMLPVLVFARYRADATVVGWLVGAFGGGAVLGSLAASRLFAVAPALRLARIGALLFPWPLWLLAPSGSSLVVGAALLAAGIANGISNPAVYAVQTGRIARERRTEVASAFVTITLSAGAVGLALAGPALDAFGVRDVALAIAALATVAGLAMALAPAGPAGPTAPAA